MAGVVDKAVTTVALIMVAAASIAQVYLQPDEVAIIAVLSVATWAVLMPPAMHTLLYVALTIYAIVRVLLHDGDELVALVVGVVGCSLGVRHVSLQGRPVVHWQRHF
jgi:hypothetical protein